MADQRFGPYALHKEVGRGGMGMVYFAEDTRTGHFVALKVLPDHLSRDPKFRERFQREARAATRVEHPGLCPVFEVGEVDGAPFLVMPFLDGTTLSARLAELYAAEGDRTFAATPARLAFVPVLPPVAPAVPPAPHP